MTESLKRQVSAYPVAMGWIVVRVLAESGFYAWFFYRSFWGMILLIVPGFYRLVSYGNRLERKKRKEFEGQFQECIMSVSTALRAGYSLENAFAESLNDMKTMFGEKSRIVSELKGIGRGLRNNRRLQDLLEELGRRSGSVAVKEFADLLKIAVAGGGNLVEIIATTAGFMGQERRIIAEIETTVSSKKLEGKIMSVIPFAMVIYVQGSTPGYFEVFYHNLSGVLIMTICLAVYLIAVNLIDKILEITG